MAHLLSYDSGVIGYGLSKDLDLAIAEAVERCTDVQCGAKILSYNSTVVAEIKWDGKKYTAKKMEIM